MLNHYLSEITKLEFLERDLEIPELVTRKMEEMNSRGILHSGMTLRKVSEFFIGEFLVRNDFIRDFVVSNSDMLEVQGGNDNITDAKNIFQSASYPLKKSLIKLYFSSIKKISDGLANQSMIQALENNFEEKMENRIRKNNLYIEIAYQKEKLEKSKPKSILSLRPNVNGVSVDLHELWSKFVKT